ncbi:hypothetical protein HY493_05430 [Candidatus Woesearchaeota archaeon]|nr:hypothetical protein [Candidatus Woesearchaeota archaeon]
MNKKAALELSINAIVVLILAITILGLGIGFIRGQFGGLSEQFTQVRAEIKDQLITKIRESGDLLVFNRAELEVATGKKDTFYIGVKNTESNPDGDTVCYQIGVKCIRSLKSDNSCTPDIQGDAGNNIVVGGKVDGQGADQVTWFQVFDTVDIKNLDVGVYPVTVQIAKGKPDTYAMEIIVAKDSQNGDCSRGGVFTRYQSKQFFVVLS